MRVIVETQSNPLFRGQHSEQSFDQRGGLCQVGHGNVVVTTDEIDCQYLEYWQQLGFTLPTLIQAGSFDPALTLSELIVAKPAVQQDIKLAVNGSPARIELFWVAECDIQLSEVLNIPLYCNPAVSIEYACKYRFKQFCNAVGLRTAPWIGGVSIEEVVESYRRSDLAHGPALIKAANSTGGLNLGTIVWIDSATDLANNLDKLANLVTPLVVEQAVDVWSEVTVHWEIHDDGVFTIIGIFDQLAKNHSYAGAGLPTTLPLRLQQSILHDLQTRFIPALQEINAKGFFCCDILILQDETVLWTDFNPRKGAILYVYDMVRRLGVAQGWQYEQMPYVWQPSFWYTRSV